MGEQITILNDLDLSAKHLSAHGVECEIVQAPLISPNRHIR